MCLESSFFSNNAHACSPFFISFCTASPPHPVVITACSCVCLIAVVNAAPEDLIPEEPALDLQSTSPEVPECEDIPDVGTPEVEIPECGISEPSTLEEAAASVEHDVPEEGPDEDYVETAFGPPAVELPEAADAAAPTDSPDSPVSEDVKTPTG